MSENLRVFYPHCRSRQRSARSGDWRLAEVSDRDCIDSAPSLGVYYFFVVDSVCLFVCVSRCSFKLLLLFLFLDGIEPFFGLQLSMWHSTKLFL